MGFGVKRLRVWGGRILVFGVGVFVLGYGVISFWEKTGIRSLQLRQNKYYSPMPPQSTFDPTHMNLA